MKIRFDDIDELFSRVECYAEKNGLKQTFSALRFARIAHSNQVRKGDEDRPYFIHPLTMAMNAIALGLINDDLLSAVLLHDVCEDCDVAIDKLPVNKGVQETVRRLSKNYSSGHEQYYAGIADDPNACIVKCLDRINNMSEMSAVFSKKRMAKYALEAEKCILPLIRKAQCVRPEWKDALWALDFQLETLINIYSNLINDN